VNAESDLARTVLARCLTPDPADFFEPFEEWTGRSSPLSSVVEAFRSNLRAARLVGALPYQLINSGVRQRRFDGLVVANLIESGAQPDSEVYSEQQEQACRHANEAMQQLDTEIINQTLHRLDYSLKSPTFSGTLHELLRQVLVMTWGALEVVSNDLGVVILNKRPALARVVTDLESYKRAASVKGIPIVTLEEFNFDVSESMGDIIFSMTRLDTLPSIMDFYNAVASNAALQKSLKSSTLWMLAQRRHLIVHRRGIVDSQYLQKTSDSQPLGTLIEIPATEIANSLVEVRNVGLLIADCASVFFE